MYRAPTSEQILHYDRSLLEAVRAADLAGLERQRSLGKSMSACNRFSESVLHMACRRSTAPVVHFLLSNGADPDMVDDFGRTAAHDACWRAEPDFDLLALLLDRNSELLRCVDDRGNTPLDYVRREHWPQWRQLLNDNKDKYWSAKVTGSCQKRDGEGRGEAQTVKEMTRRPQAAPASEPL